MDASITQAPNSTNNQDNVRDPDIHQTRKGNQWYFGMKAHIGVDSQNRLIHSVVATYANVHDSAVIEDLLHDDEIRVWGDSAYTDHTSLPWPEVPLNTTAVDIVATRYRATQVPSSVSR